MTQKNVNQKINFFIFFLKNIYSTRFEHGGCEEPSKDLVGRGAAEAARWRQWVAQESWRMQKEQMVHMLGLRQGRPVLRRAVDYFLQ